jgi:hypothetical protein
VAVLPRPPSRHVRRPGEAIAIVDLDDAGGRVASPRVGPQARRRLGAAALGATIGLTIALWPAPLARSAVRAAASPSPGPASAAADVLLGSTDTLLRLPSGVVGVDLAAIPDRLLNDQPAARLRIPVFIRGTRGIASVDAPAEISWTEAGYWYWMRSSDLSITQLIDLASALR